MSDATADEGFDFFVVVVVWFFVKRLEEGQVLALKLHPFLETAPGTFLVCGTTTGIHCHGLEPSQLVACSAFSCFP